MALSTDIKVKQTHNDFYHEADIDATFISIKNIISNNAHTGIHTCENNVQVISMHVEATQIIDFDLTTHVNALQFNRGSFHIKSIQ